MSSHANAPTRATAGRPMLAPKVYYFSFFAAGAALLPYLGLYYASIGLNGRAIGLLTGLPPLITLVAAPLWGGVADAAQRHKQLLLTAITGAMVMVLALSAAQGLGWLMVCVLLYAFFSAPIVALVDNTVLAMLGPEKDRYGKQRVWGSIGWGVSGAVMGIVIQRLGLQVSFYGYVAFMAVGLLAASRLPVAAASIGVRYWEGLRVFLGNREWTVFLVAVFSASITMGMYNNFLFIYLDQLGAPKTLMGASLVAATLSELPVFFYADKLLARGGRRGVLMIALAASVVRMFAYAWMPAAWWVLPIHLLHGLTFSALWAAGVANADALAPAGMGATAQGLFGSVVFGFGAATGALLGGFLLESVGADTMFGIAGGIVLAGLVFYALMSRAPGAPGA